MAEDADDDEVGYGKPPKQFWWPKGVSGNPRGREKGHKGLKTDLEAALNAVNTVENKLTGRQVKGRNQQLMLQRLVERAALGDLKAMALLLPMVLQVLGPEDRHKGAKRLSAVDQAIFAELLGERLEEASEPETGDNQERLLPPPDTSAEEGQPDEEGDDEQAD